MTFIDKPYLKHLIKKYFLDRDLKTNKCIMTHNEAIKIYTLPLVDMCTLYARNLQIMMTVAFLVTLIPLAPLIAAIGFLLTYWAEKYSFIHH